MTKFALISLFFLFSINIALASEISQFVFTTNPQTIKPNEVSGKLTVQAQDASGNPVNSHLTACLELTTTSSTGQFSASSTNWGSVGKLMLTMNSNWANRNFYYKDSTAGNYTLTVKAALTSCSSWVKEEWVTSQNIVVSNTAEPTTPEPTSTETAPEPTPGVGSATDWPIEPQIFANAGKDKTVIVGADVYFSGQAAGLKKEPLEGVRFLWNFGDGAFKEGQNISHIYKYPGEYIVALDVSSGKYSASDYALVKAVPSQIKISEANKDFIKLSNESNVTLDISGWFIRLENKTFKFPASTLIKANSTLIIPSSNSGLEAGNDVVVELLYSNASKAFSWQKKQQEPAPTTVVGKNDYNSKEKENIIEDKSTSPEQTASVITVGKKDFWTPKKWWGLIILIGILSGAGFLFIRHKTTVPKL